MNRTRRFSLKFLSSFLDGKLRGILISIWLLWFFLFLYNDNILFMHLKYILIRKILIGLRIISLNYQSLLCTVYIPYYLLSSSNFCLFSHHFWYSFLVLLMTLKCCQSNIWRSSTEFTMKFIWPLIKNWNLKAFPLWLSG